MNNTTPVFGSCDPGIVYTYRCAAYLVAINASGAVAAVKGRVGYFLPGGGCLDNETAEQTIHREISEEIACGVELTGKTGEAFQYFSAASDGCQYLMHATFFVGRLTGDSDSPLRGEHELLWLCPAAHGRLFFHECHDWAVECAVNEQKGGTT